MAVRKIDSRLNSVYLGDIRDLLRSLPDRSIDMVYGDPDYNVGVKYGMKVYTRSFEDYMKWYIGLASESLRVLKDDGNMFLINYPKQNAHLRVKYLDGACHDVQEYVWVYNTNVGHSPRKFTTAHRSILHCRKSPHNRFYKEHVAEPYKNPNDRRILHNMSHGSKGRMPYDWFYYDLVKNVSREKTFHSCQIPQKLSSLLVSASTMENDTVLILFGGSGSEIEVCLQLKRNYISAEIDRKYYDLIMERIKGRRGKEGERVIENIPVNSTR